MAVKVSNAPATPKLKVTTNNGYQGSTYNPQRTSNPQKTAPVKVIQPAATAGVYQPTRNANQIQAAAEAQRIAVAAELARQSELRRQQVSGNVSSRTEAHKSAIKLKVAKATPVSKVRVGANYAPAKINVPKNSLEDNEYLRIKNEAKQQAMRLVDYTKADPSSGFWGKAVDKITFGADRRASNARSYAEERAQQLADRQIKVYQDKLDAHNKMQADLQADYEKKRSLLSPSQLNALADEYNLRLEQSVKDLNNVAAYTEGMLEGYGVKSEEKITSLPGSSAGWFNRNVVQKAVSNPIWKYTLGEGDKNIPSIVTAPSRLVNLIGNLNTKERDIYKYGGETANRVNSRDNAWQSTFNQRNFNIRPVIDKPYDKTVAWAELKNGKSVISTSYSAKFKNAKTDEERENIAKEYWNDKNRSARNQNSVTEIAADPLNFIAGLGAIAKLTGKLDDVGRASKATAWAYKSVDKIKETANWAKLKAAENPLIKSLGAEAKTRQEVLQDAIKARTEARKAHFDKWDSSYKQMVADVLGKPVSDLKVIDDVAAFSDKEAAIFQRIVNGKLAPADAMTMLATHSKPARTLFMDTVNKYKTLMDEVAEADRITKANSRFLGEGTKMYIPRAPILYDDVPEAGWFRRFKKSDGTMSSDYMNESIRQRLFDSEYEQVMGQRYSKATKAEKGMSAMRKEKLDLEQEYDYEIRQAKNKTKSFVGRTEAAWNKVNPVNFWKKFVLKYRPAWTVNNVLYNTQAGMLSGGMGYIPEQIKMLSPRYASKASKEIPKELLQDLAKESGGKSRLNRFYNTVENNPRVAAYRALKQKGLTDEQALKRVNKYFFDYKTKNWERPIKAVLPFWAWQKNLTKAAVQMPFDRPAAAIAYNRLDKHQKLDFEKQFSELVPQLQELGYTEDEIEQIKAEQAKYFASRLRVGDKYYTTPFNAFSEQGLTNMGFNPYFAAAGEAAEGVDSFGRKISGYEASLKRRLTTKFPQAELGYKRYKSYRVDKGIDKPSEKYIGKEGSEGYGLTKEKQGYDPSKPNYVPSMDPRTKSKQDIEAFFGKPRSLTFDKDKLIETKKLQKITADYFAKSAGWKDMEFEAAEKERQAVFDKYGITADEFYKGILSKYDTEHTTGIKAKKEQASIKNKALFEEYAKQPQGTRNLWATKKLQELVNSGYFNDNPFLKSFKWINQDSFKKADKQAVVKRALQTGDWSQYRRQYGSNKSSPYQYSGKYFKSAESMERYKEGEFWLEYANASKEERRKLLAATPQYNRRADWTEKQWDDWKREKRAKDIIELSKKGSSGYANYLAKNKKEAQRFILRAQISKGKTKKVAYR